jgi:hypothetical protein
MAGEDPTTSRQISACASFNSAGGDIGAGWRPTSMMTADNSAADFLPRLAIA